jgi:hypothetical protein
MDDQRLIARPVASSNLTCRLACGAAAPARSSDVLGAEESPGRRCRAVDAASTGSVQRDVTRLGIPPVMIGFVVLAVLGAWLVLSALAAVGCAAAVRGGIEEDLARGYLSYRR